jgi:hypothetical protein
VAEFAIGELPVAGVRDERGDPVPVDIGESHLLPGMRPFGPDDDPHPLRPARQREEVRDVGHPRSVPDLPVTLIGHRPRFSGAFLHTGFRLLLSVNPIEYDNR